MGMTILQDYETRVDCDDSHCSLRYYIKGEPLSIGLVRVHYYDAGGLNGLIVTVSEWNIGNLLSDISDNHGLGPNEMVEYMGTIKTHVIQKVKEHLTLSGEQPTSD
jgi:hypothetical protein